MASGRRDANDSGSTWRPFRKKLQCSFCHINQSFLSYSTSISIDDVHLSLLRALISGEDKVLEELTGSRS